jgi:hypothetical protein
LRITLQNFVAFGGEFNDWNGSFLWANKSVLCFAEKKKKKRKEKMRMKPVLERQGRLRHWEEGN